jgi:hypothetical protein
LLDVIRMRRELIERSVKDLGKTPKRRTGVLPFVAWERVVGINEGKNLGQVGRGGRAT